MGVFNVIYRELLEASRRDSSFWIRALGALVVGAFMVTLIWIYGRMGEGPSALGRNVFFTTCWLVAVVSIVSGASITSDAVSAERRNGTLGLLLLTSLKKKDVILGKLVASSLQLVYMTIGVAPVLVIPVLTGGVPWELIALTILCIFALFGFGLVAGLFASCCQTDAKASLVFAISIVLIIQVAIPLIGYWVDQRSAWLAVNPFATLSGFSALMDVTEAAYSGAPVVGDQQMWASIGVTFGLILAFVVLSAVALALGWRRDMEGGRKETTETRRRVNRSPYHRIVSPIGERDPFVWLARRGAAVRNAWIIYGALVLFWVWIVAQNARVVTDPVAVAMTALIVSFVFKLLYIGEACRMLHRERQTGALELALTTSLKDDEIVRSLQSGLRSIFMPIFWSGIVFSMYLLIMAMRELPPNDTSGLLYFAFILSILVLSGLDAVAIEHIGLWQGLSRRNYQAAHGLTFGVVVVLPLGVFCGLMLLFVIGVAPFVNVSDEFGVTMILLLWAAVCCATTGMFLRDSRSKLYQEFRSVAATPLERRR